jgi:S-DNA-T family DNA segregation ATPase FtsK/SpoIIIE
MSKTREQPSKQQPAKQQPARQQPLSYTRTPTERQPLPNRLVRLLSEARWFALAALALYVVLIMISYNKADPGWSHANVVPKVYNLGGRAGAWLSDLMLFIFGFSAWWWAVWLLRIVWSGYRRLTRKFLTKETEEDEHRHEGLIRVVGFAFLLVGSLGLEFLRMYTLKVQLPRAPGGVLGQLIGHGAHVGLGFTGATLLLLLLFGLGFSLFFHVSWLAVAERIGGFIEDCFDWMAHRYQDREDRLQGERATVKREEVVVNERAKHIEKHVEKPVRAEPRMGAPAASPSAGLAGAMGMDGDDAPMRMPTPAPTAAPEKFLAPMPVKIEQQVTTVVPSDRAVKERQGALFQDSRPGDLPPLSLLDDAPVSQETVAVETLEFTSRLIEKKLSDFGVEARVVAAYPGPVVTRYEIEPGARPGAFAVADVDPRGGNHPGQELHGAGAAQSQAPDRAPV